MKQLMILIAMVSVLLGCTIPSEFSTYIPQQEVNMPRPDITPSTVLIPSPTVPMTNQEKIEKKKLKADGSWETPVTKQPEKLVSVTVELIHHPDSNKLLMARFTYTGESGKVMLVSDVKGAARVELETNLKVVYKETITQSPTNLVFNKKILDGAKSATLTISIGDITASSKLVLE